MNTNHFIFFCASVFFASVSSAQIDLGLKAERAIQLSFQTKTGKSYLIESSPDVQPARWKVEGNTIEGTGNIYQTTFLTDLDARRLFRVEQGDLRTGLVAFYPFTENADDLSGNGNNGTVSGAVLSIDRFGRASEAYRFDGTNDYVSLPDS